MSFQQGLSGLNAAAKNLEVIGNNVANSSTVGFKQGQTQFADVYAASLSGAMSGSAGIGVKVSGIAQQFTQGGITASSNPLDIAINGDGFFRMTAPNGAVSYSRNGQFHTDKDGYIVNAQGASLSGYTADARGNLATGAPAPLNINTAAARPSATTQMAATMNLDSRAPVLSAAAFDMTDSTTYTNASSVNVFDSLGNPHTLQTYYVKTGAATWQVFGSADGAALGYAPPAAPVPMGTIAFNSDGTLNAGGSTLPMVASIPVGGGATTPMAVEMDFSKTSQYGQAFGVTALSQDGYTAGSLTGFAVGQDGVITGRYTNGTSAVLGQVVLASFKNPNGLISMGDNSWVESAAAGTAVIGAPNSGTMGVLTQGVEESNVDLTAQLVEMISAQRNYQANAQTIKTQDGAMQTLMSLR